MEKRSSYFLRKKKKKTKKYIKKKTCRVMGTRTETSCRRYMQKLSEWEDVPLYQVITNKDTTFTIVLFKLNFTNSFKIVFFTIILTFIYYSLFLLLVSHIKLFLVHVSFTTFLNSNNQLIKNCIKDQAFFQALVRLQCYEL